MELVEPIRDKKQLDNMKRYLKEHNLRDYLLFVLGINSGLRISDLLNLQVEDVKGKDRIRLQEQKTGKRKEFPLGESSKKAIAAYLRQTNDTCGSLFPSRKKAGSQGSGAISRQQAYAIINGAARAVGIKSPIGTHTLRKTFGYWAYKSGYDLSQIQQLLNHASPQITLRYIGITQEELDQIYIHLNL